MHRKHLHLAMIFAACLLYGSVAAQTLPSVVTGAVPVSSTNLPVPGEPSRRAINSSKDGAICSAVLWAVKNNIQSQLSGESIQSVSLADPKPVYANTNSTHCVTQLSIIDSSGETNPYTLNYDVSASGFLGQVYAEYNRATNDPFHLYTYEQFMEGLSPSQAYAATTLQIKRARIAPYLQIVFNQNAGLSARIEVYSKMCSSQLVESDLILQSQAQALLKRLTKDYLAAVNDAYASDSYVGPGYVETPSQRQVADNLQSIYCVFYGVFPSNAHKGLSFLEASPKGSLLPVAWALGEITNEGTKAADLLPTLVKWYTQTLIQAESRDSFAESDGAKSIHATTADLILRLAGKDENQYLNMMMQDPDPQIAKDATDQLLAAPSSATLATQASDAQDGQRVSESEFVSQIKEAVDVAKRYPRDAVLAGDTGTVQVAFDYVDGKVKNAQIQTSSGSKNLDRAALQAVNNAVFPSPPQDSVGKTLHIVIPVEFRLGGSNSGIIMPFQLPPDAIRIVAADDWDIYHSPAEATLYICPTSYHASPFALSHKNLAKLLLSSAGNCPDDLKTALGNYLQAPDGSSHISSESISKENIDYGPERKEKASDQQDKPKATGQSAVAPKLSFSFGEPVVTSSTLPKTKTRKIWRNPWVLGLLLFISFIAYIEITAPPATPNDMLMPGSERVLQAALPACNDHDKYEALMKEWDARPDANDFTAFAFFVANHQCTFLPGGSTIKVIDFDSFDGVKVLVESDTEPSQYMNEFWINRAHIPEVEAPSASTSSR